MLQSSAKEKEGETMKEILFRGKPSNALSDEEWLFGLLVKQLDLDGTDELHIQTWERDKEGVSSRVLGVIPGTVGQYTGLKDEKGTMIFEGDIVTYINTDGIKFNGVALTVTGKVVYNEKTASFSVFGKDEIGAKHVDYFSIKNIEVIGNIHDNPELIQERREDEKDS